MAKFENTLVMIRIIFFFLAGVSLMIWRAFVVVDINGYTYIPME